MLNKYTLLDIVSEVTQVSKEDILSRSRTRHKVVARQLYSYFARTSLNMTLKDIGLQFGIHHSTIIHSIELVKDMISTNDTQYISHINSISKHIKEIQQRETKLIVYVPYNVDPHDIALLLKDHQCKVLNVCNT